MCVYIFFPEPFKNKLQAAPFPIKTLEVFPNNVSTLLKFIKAKNFNKNMRNSKCAVIRDVDSSGEGGQLRMKYTQRQLSLLSPWALTS